MRKLTATVLVLAAGLLAFIADDAAAQTNWFQQTMDPATAFRELDEFTIRFSYTIESASNEIIAQADDMATKRRAVVWRIRAITAARRALQEPPRQALIDQLTYAVQMRQYLTIGDGKEIFGQWQQIAVDASVSIEDDLMELFEANASEEAFNKMRVELEEWAERHPIRGTMRRSSRRVVDFDERGSAQQKGNPLLELPFAPIRMVIGIDKATDEMQRTQLVLAQATALVNFLPQRMRWETELMFYDIEGRQSLQRTLDQLDVVSSELGRLVEVADNLPAVLRQELLTLGENDAAFSSVERLAQSIDSAAGSIAAAGQAWSEATRAIGDLVPAPADDAPPREPFAIDDYTRAAEAFTTTAAELRGLTEQIESLTRNEHGETGLGAAKAQGVNLIDHITLRAIQVVAAIFILAIVYRLLSVMITRKWGVSGSISAAKSGTCVTTNKVNATSHTLTPVVRRREE